MGSIMRGHDLETEANEVATGFQADKADAVRCWQQAVDASGLDDKVLAADARMSKGYYSKVASGEQGDLLGLVYRLGEKHPDLRHDFFCRLAELEMADPLDRAAEQLVRASVRFLRLRGERLPLRMANATAADRKRRSA